MARKPQDNPQLDMTPMIDVVFELIIFFVVTIQQEDVLSKLNANRPAPSSGKSESESDTTVTIEIGRGHDANGLLVYNRREVRRSELDQNLREVARTSKKTPIIIKCAEDSPHKALVDALDICYRNQLFSVSIFTM
ncbi:MAG: biopolymer transporter ExbD [Kiritimatiellae bacterium]|nr:biopolymer transporter ExbD [Kiritimatiellia bacterium]MBQ3343531.1 biopolymer transporter ExbD [Kiritimatiellia bacterium]MBQ6328578.1 biopolymer transporter ExbD [Kiritimatiellia bacterium]